MGRNRRRRRAADHALATITDLRQLPIVEVVWLDATSSSEPWSSLAEARAEALLEMSTVGRLIRCDREVVAVVQTINNNGKVNQNWMIPRTWVIRITELQSGRTLV